ncbi:MAG: dihydropteroate synthase [Opitutales bacterium]|nr:dihydropteroate synthase [Opitutales bacterium]
MNTENRQLHVIGELMNNSYGRARKAWKARDLDGYQNLARLQAESGASFLTFNIDGTRTLPVTLAEMLEFLPRVIPAIQEVTDLPISFDNPDVAFHTEALKYFDRSRCRGRPILNSLSVTRADVRAMIDLVGEHDMDVIVMASEYQTADGEHQAAKRAGDIVKAARHFAELLDCSGISNDRIIVDPGLCPIASDTCGGVNLCLDAIRALRTDYALEGIHISVGLSNFSIGAPGEFRIPLERAFLSLAIEAGLDYILANPEKNTEPLPTNDPMVTKLREVLAEGRPLADEDPEEAGYRQLDALMELYGS